MSLWKDAKSPALKTEEAALLPALPRRMAGGAALKSVVSRGGTLRKETRLSLPAAAVIGDQPPARPRDSAFPQAGRKRAALYQVWKKPYR